MIFLEAILEHVLVWFIVTIRYPPLPPCLCTYAIDIFDFDIFLDCLRKKYQIEILR